MSGSVLGVWALALWLAALAAGPAYATSESAPWTGFAGVTETTAAIMARQAADRLPAIGRTVRPGRVPAMRGRPQHPAAYELERTGALAAARTAPAPAVALTPSTSFTGATLADTGAFPPDSMGAVGPSQFVVAVNGRLRTFNKASGVADGVLDTTMDDFFASVMTPVSPNFTSDPRIRYDRLSGRWFVLIIDVPGGNGTAPNRVLLAVSNAASAGVITASTVWTYFFFEHDTVSPPGDTGDFADFPTLGVDANALYVGVNVFAPSSSFVNSTGFVVRKSSVLGAGPIVVTAFRSLLDASSNGPYTPQGVDNPDSTATVGYFIGVDGAFFGRLQLRRVTNPGGAPSLSGNLAVNVPATAYPILVPHLGNTGGANGQLDSLDDRLSNAIIRNGSLWTTHNIGVDNTGSATGTVTRNGVRWYQIGSLDTTPALVQSGIVFTSSGTNNTSSRHYWIPSITASGQGHVALGFSTAGSLERANAGTTGRLAGDAAGTTATPTLYTASATAYNPPSDAGGAQGRRWGDFSYTSPDPDDDMTLWTIQEFCNATNSYGVRVVKLLAPPPATPSSASPASVPAGQPSTNVTITGTSTAGSGFFDPGAGFARRIGATVTGGVTVNSVTYTDPTHVVLNVSTVGASAGAQDVTVVNPDGQSAAGAGILVVQASTTTTTSTSTSSTTSTTSTTTTTSSTSTSSTSTSSTTSTTSTSSSTSTSSTTSSSTTTTSSTSSSSSTSTSTSTSTTSTSSSTSTSTSTSTTSTNSSTSTSTSTSTTSTTSSSSTTTSSASTSTSTTSTSSTSTTGSSTTSSSTTTSMTTTTNSTTSTTVPPLCGPAPASGCRLAQAGAASVLLRDNVDDARDQLRWMWKRGAATALADFKDPVNGSASYRVCLYDSSGSGQPLMETAIPPGSICGTRPCWRTSGTTGFRYKNADGMPDGITAANLRSGVTGRASVSVKGKGANLPTPALGLTLPVTVQLVISDGVTTDCWQTTYATAIANDATRFNAKGP